MTWEISNDWRAYIYESNILLLSQYSSFQFLVN